MPIQKKKYTKKRPIGKSTKALTVSQLTQDVKRLNTKITRMAKPELEFFETMIATPASVAYNLDVFNYALCTPVQGLAEGQRKSDQISLNDLKIRGTIFSGTVLSVQNIRVTLIQSKTRFQPSMITSSGNQSVWDVAGTNDIVNSFFSWENRGLFRVLRDFKMTVAPGYDASIPNQKTFNINYRFNKSNRLLKFQPGSTTTVQNQIYLLVTSDQINTTPVTATFTSRITYYDN